MDDGVIKVADFIQDDGTIERIIAGLDNLIRKLGGVDEELRETAKEAVKNLKDVASATQSGEAQIEQLTMVADGLARAFANLRIAQSEAGKEMAWYKSQVSATNRETVRYRKELQMAEGSYDKINAELQENIKLWNALTPAERSAADYGQKVAKTIQDLRQKLKDVSTELAPVKEQMTELQKAEEKLAYLQSEEGQKLLEVRKQISELMNGRKEQKEDIDNVTKALQALQYTYTEEYAEIQKLNAEKQKQAKIVQYTNMLNNSAEGSYDKLKAQYELNKIKLREMSQEERKSTEEGKLLELQTRDLYKALVRLQEGEGTYEQAIGKFKMQWNGLSNATTQIIRELPAAAVSLNTFFLGISNNIPILIDEIQRVREKNKLLIAEGKEAQSVIKTITASIFNWQTAIVILLTVMSMHGKEIIDWTKKIITANKWIKSTTELLGDVNKELEKTSGSYGQNRASLQKLSDEWKKLTSDKEKLQFIKDNKSEFDKLDVSVRNVADAENLLVENTEAMIMAMQYRAKAAAAAKLAADSYEKSLREQMNAETLEKNGPGTLGKVVGGMSNFSLYGLWYRYYEFAKTGKWKKASDIAQDVTNKQIELSSNAKKSYEEEGDAFTELMNLYNEEARKAMRDAGIEEAHKYDKDRSRQGRDRSRQGRDLTDRIWKNDLSIRKKYEMSITQLQRDEFAKRRLEAVDQTNATIREMQEKFRQNEAFIANVDGKYKPLTPEQKKQIEEQQKEIASIIENADRKLQIDLQNIEYEQQIDNLKKMREVLDWRIDIIAKSIEEEKKLRLEQLEEEEALYSTKASTVNGEAVVTGTMTPEQIAAYQRKKQQIIAEYTKLEVQLYKQRMDDELELTKKGTEEEIRLLLERNEAERKLALAENMLKPASERRDESDINAIYDQRRLRIRGGFDLDQLDEAQELADAEFNIVKRNEYQITKFKLNQERERWKKQIELAKEGALDWSDAQIKTAEAQLKRIERELKENELSLIADKGLGGALLSKLGFDDDMIDALSDATNIVIDNIRMIIDAEIEAAEKAVEIAEKRVSAAQSAYDAEVEARNNGYANNVATAKKELQLEKKNQREKQKILEAAQKKQEAIDTAMQVSSLITATANLWKSYSSMGPFSVAAAIAATAAMWGSFAYAKVKAKQIAAASEQEYGEGGLEILEGGSHASGNDIDLHTTNSRGKNMRAEGGEALAIINKKNTRKYRRVLPAIVDSLNKGTFENKYAQAFQTGDRLAAQISFRDSVDLSKLEQDVHDLKKNSETKYFVGANGSVIITKKNTTRIIRS